MRDRILKCIISSLECLELDGMEKTLEADECRFLIKELEGGTPIDPPSDCQCRQSDPWIPVGERAPPEGNNVLVFIKREGNFGIGIAYRLENHWWGGIYSSIGEVEVNCYYPEGGETLIKDSYCSHWMPLPNNPKDEENETH